MAPFDAEGQTDITYTDIRHIDQRHHFQGQLLGD